MERMVSIDMLSSLIQEPYEKVVTITEIVLREVVLDDNLSCNKRKKLKVDGTNGMVDGTLLTLIASTHKVHQISTLKLCTVKSSSMYAFLQALAHLTAVLLLDLMKSKFSLGHSNKGKRLRK